MTSIILQYCTIAIAVSFASVISVGSFALILGIFCVILGKDKD
jgi:hypothetical protein